MHSQSFETDVMLYDPQSVFQYITVPTISAYTRWNCLATTEASKSSSTPILTVRCSFQRVSASGQFDAAELIRYMITKPQRRQPDQTHLKLLQMSGDVHPNPGPDTK